MRKQSIETQLRHAKRDLGILKRQNENLWRKIQWGGMMANICFNLAQDERIEERHRKSMKQWQEAWDGIRL